MKLFKKYFSPLEKIQFNILYVKSTIIISHVYKKYEKKSKWYSY